MITNNTTACAGVEQAEIRERLCLAFVVQGSSRVLLPPRHGKWLLINTLRLLDCVHRSSRSEPFVLVAQFRDLKEGIYAIAFKTMDL